MKTAPKTEIEFEVADILAAEYEYIAQTAFQAHEDRSRVTSFYLVSIGSLFGAFLSTKLGEFSPNNLTLAYMGFSGLFIFLSYFGYMTLMQLVYLRDAWFDSITAMNTIKKFLVEKDPSLRPAFLWYAGNEPDRFKKKNVAFLLAKQVASLGAITAGTAVFFFGKIFSTGDTTTEIGLSILGIIAGTVFFFYQLAQYKHALKK